MALDLLQHMVSRLPGLFVGFQGRISIRVLSGLGFL